MLYRVFITLILSQRLREYESWKKLRSHLIQSFISEIWKLKVVLVPRVTAFSKFLPQKGHEKSPRTLTMWSMGFKVWTVTFLGISQVACKRIGNPTKNGQIELKGGTTVWWVRVFPRVSQAPASGGTQGSGWVLLSYDWSDPQQGQAKTDRGCSRETHSSASAWLRSPIGANWVTAGLSNAAPCFLASAEKHSWHLSMHSVLCADCGYLSL